MGRKKLAAILISLGLTAAAAVGGSLAYFTDSEETNNVITMGHVDITLEEPLFSGSGDVVFEEGKYVKQGVVYPGQQIVKDPTIRVEEGSQDCYLRVKITVDGFAATKDPEKYKKDILDRLVVNTAEEGRQPSYVTLEQAGWKLADDGYYYHCEPGRDADGKLVFIKSAAKDQVKVFSGFSIPREWDNDAAEAGFEVIINAEAVQAGAFTPYDDGVKFGWYYVDGEAGTQVLTPVTAETYR